MHCTSNLFEKVLRLAVDLYQHCYLEVKEVVKQKHHIILTPMNNSWNIFQAGDVELTKAWIKDLAILGLKIPPFNHRPTLQGEELSCAAKVPC